MDSYKSLKEFMKQREFKLGQKIYIPLAEEVRQGRIRKTSRQDYHIVEATIVDIKTYLEGETIYGVKTPNEEFRFDNYLIIQVDGYCTHSCARNYITLKESDCIFSSLFDATNYVELRLLEE